MSDPRIVITFNTATRRVEVQWPDGWPLTDHMMAEAQRMMFEAWLAERKTGGAGMVMTPTELRVQGS